MKAAVAPGIKGKWEIRDVGAPELGADEVFSDTEALRKAGGLTLFKGGDSNTRLGEKYDTLQTP